MYEQEPIFGPFNFKQFIVIAASVGVAFFAHNTFEGRMAWAIIIFALLIGGYFVQQLKGKRIPIEQLERYLMMKKTEIGPDKFNKYVAMKLAMLVSHMEMRRSRGITPDEDAMRLKSIFEKFLAEAGIPPIPQA